MPAAKTLLLVDDHPLFVDGFAAMVRATRPDWNLLTEASSRSGCARLAQHDGIDIAIVDLKLPDRDGFETLAEMAFLRPTIPRIAISGREDAAARSRAAQASANGYIAKSAPAQDIIIAIEQVMSGGSVFEMAGAAADMPHLSPRQGDVLGLLATGCSNKEIRARLGIAERTVRAHLTELFLLLRVNSRVQALLKARELGLLE